MTIFKIHVVFLLICLTSSLHSAECDNNVTKVPAFPAKIEAYENQDVYVKMPVNLDMKSCIVEYRSDNVTLWPQNIPHLLKEKVEFWGNASVCGVHVMGLTTNDAGTWSLLIISSTDDIIESKFTLKVENFPNVTIPDEDVFLESNNMLLNFIPIGLDVTYYCVVRRPNHDEDMFYYNEECSKVVTSLTKAYDGEWSSRIGLKGMMEEKEYTLNIRVEEERVDSGIAVSEGSADNAQSLYCNIISPSHEHVEYCLFIRPGDDTTLVISDGIDTESYSYYGNGFKNKSCGVTVKDPQSLDYGIWKCIVKCGTVIHGSSILLANNSHEIKVKEETLIKEVLLGSHLEIAIEATQVIDTCIFVSPDDSFILGIAEQMKLGMCYVEISSAQKEHNGTWLCQMIINRQYMTTEFLVIIQESVFIADQTTKTVETGMSTALSCHSVPLNSFFQPSLGTCKFIRPDGFMMAMADENTDILGRYKYYGNGISKGQCGVFISSASPEDHGIWKCFAEIEQNSLTEEQFAIFSLEVEESTLITPSYVTVDQDGEVVITFLDTFQNILSCTVETPSGDIINLSDGGNSDVSYWGNFENGECGAKINGKMLKDETDVYQKWQLTARTQKETENNVSAVSWIKVIPRIHNYKAASQKIFADEGSVVEINCGDGYETDCIIVSPGKDLQQGIVGPCKQNIRIHRTDFGIWICYIGYNSHLLEEVREVEIIDMGKQENIGWQNSTLWNESTDLFCEIKKPLQYCSFVSPSGEAFKVQAGQGADNYVYFGKGLMEGDCGITILQPVEELKGIWRCLFGLAENDSLKHSARFINIMNNTDKYIDSGRKQIVILNQNTKIQCQIPEKLTYCWIQHPNSSHFPSNIDAHNGICSFEILPIDDTYAGDWICHMGTLDDEIISTVTVEIAESQIYAVNKRVSNIGNTVSFSCHTVVNNIRLQYCRFVRSDGVGFSFTTNIVHGKYEYQGAGIEHGECGLKVSDLSAEDYGQWTCAALISGETAEVMDTIIVLQSAGMSVNLVIGLTVGLVSVVAIIIILYWIKKKKRHSSISSISVNSDSSSNSDVSIFSRSNNASENGSIH